MNVQEWPPDKNRRQTSNGTGGSDTGFNDRWDAMPKRGTAQRSQRPERLDIPTQGRPDAHFATYPDELPRRCILAGTSERGVCADCGAPWVRQKEKRFWHCSLER